jgi:hypothetical protein
MRAGWPTINPAKSRDRCPAIQIQLGRERWKFDRPSHIGRPRPRIGRALRAKLRILRIPRKFLPKNGQQLRPIIPPDFKVCVYVF